MLPFVNFSWKKNIVWIICFGSNRFHMKTNYAINCKSQFWGIILRVHLKTSLSENLQKLNLMSSLSALLPQIDTYALGELIFAKTNRRVKLTTEPLQQILIRRSIM